MPPFPNIWTIGLTFGPDPQPTDESINRDHLLKKDYLPTKFEASGAKHSWVISCTWPLTLTFDLLTWISIGVIYSSSNQGLSTYQVRTCWAKRCGVISCTRWSRLAWPLTLTFHLLTWILIGAIYSSRTINLKCLKPEEQNLLEFLVAQGEVDWHDLYLWPTDLNSNRGNLLIKDYLPTKLSLWGKVFLSYQLHKVKGYRQTDRQTDRPTCAKQYAPPFSKGGGGDKNLYNAYDFVKFE